MEIKIWNMEPQQVNLLVSEQNMVVTCTSSTFDTSKPYIINDGILKEPSTLSAWLKNSTTMTIIFKLSSANGDVEIHELSAGEQERFSIMCSQIECSAKTSTNNLTAGITAT